MIPDPMSQGDETPSQLPIDHFSKWLRSDPIGLLASKHDHFMKNREVDMGFNLFHMISDVYHRENLHSDMMEAIISPSGSHGHGDLFLRLFLTFLRDQRAAKIQLEDYQNAKVIREDGRIDILICDEHSRKAIIVENKINGAPDMDKQLVRYVETVTNEWGYTCDAIVYICLNQRKHPDTPGWTKEERAKVWPLLHVICAYDEGSKDDLHAGWLTPCINALDTVHAESRLPQREEVAHVLRQYRQLIIKLGKTLMSKPIMEEFFLMMMDKEHYDSAIAVAAMVKNLPACRCQRVLDRFHKDPSPFAKLNTWGSSETLAIFQGLEEGPNIKLHVDCSLQDSTKLEFWNNEEDDPKSALAGQILRDIGMADLLLYDPVSEKFTRRFSFPSEENKLFQFLTDFKAALKHRPLFAV